MPTLRKLTGASAGHDGEVLACAYSADGAFVLSGGWDGYLRYWDARSGTQVTALKASDKPISACAIAPDGNDWLSGSLDGLLAYWDVKSQKQQSSFHASRRAISAIVFADDGHAMATGAWDTNLILWDVTHKRAPGFDAKWQSSQVLWRNLNGHTDVVAGCGVTPDGKTLLSWSHDGTLRLWDVKQSKACGTLTGHQDKVLAGAVSADGVWAASGSADGVLKLWDLKGQTEITSTTLEGKLIGCWFLLDGASLVVANDQGVLTVHDLPRLTLRTELGAQVRVNCGAASPRGDQLALGAVDGRVVFVAVDGLEDVPLLATVSCVTRSAASMMGRLFGKSRQVLVCVCPNCRHSFELEAAHSSTSCPGCRHKLRIKT